MIYWFKTIFRLPIGFLLVLRNIYLEYRYSGIDVLNFPGGENLRESGFHIFEELQANHYVDKLREEFRILEERNPPPKTGQMAGRIFSHGPLSELTAEFAAQYRPMAEAYFGSSNIRCELTMYQRSWPVPERGEVPGGEFHQDDNKRNLKFFVYLTDVDQESGPFSYVPDSHGYQDIITFVRWWLWEAFRKRTFLYEFGLDREKLESKSKKIVGPAGLCFCADTTGYHRANAVKHGEREVFVVSFTRNLLINI